MKAIIFIPTIIALVSCSSINVERTSPLRFDKLFIATVEERIRITLEPNESKSGRVLVGLISAGPIGALATANTEEGFSDPTAFKYTLSVDTNETKLIVSRSIAEIGNCVEVISPDESKLELLRVIPLENCVDNENKAARSTDDPIMTLNRPTNVTE
ncbi:MAG: hypothetical protein V7721_09230 [Porticoccaceae bacterium]